MIVSSNPAAPARPVRRLFGYLVFLGFPLLWMLSMSFKGPRELVQLYPPSSRRTSRSRTTGPR